VSATRTAILRLDSAEPGFDERLARLVAWEPGHDAAVERVVADVLRDVRSRGDAALLEYTRRFDRLEVAGAAALELPRAELDAALAGLAPARRDALREAADRVQSYHERQRASSWSFVDAHGSRLGQQVTPLDRVGLYVPGGKAAYPSSVLMNAIPAKVAGVRELVMVTPTPGGTRNPLVLAAAAIAGVDRVFTVGGAQAVAALAYGTATVPAVDKIVGPGNAYVAEAKRRVFGTVGIDMIAGPSEVLIIADGSADPDWVAMDLFAQAEHDELAQSILLSPDAPYLDAVHAAIDRLLPDLPRRTVIAASLAGRGALIRVASLAQACELADRIAPEHLELAVRDPAALAARIRHAGAMFLGAWSSESIGDYCAGPNHVLPTMRTARFSSPLGTYDFQKRSSVIEASPAGARALGRLAAELARGEGLEAHARSAELRAQAAPAHPEAEARAAIAPGTGAPPVLGAAGVPLIRDDVRAMSGYHVPDAGGLVKLDAMENPYPLPAGLRQGLAERLAAVALNRYPVPSYARLKALIRDRLGVPAGAGLLLGNGSDELITMVSVATARPGATVIAPAPSFVMYDLSTRLAGSTFVPVPLAPDFSLDLPAMLAAIDRHRPAVVWIAWPNNPTGNAFDRAQVERILAAAPGLVVIDEAYQPFALDTWMGEITRHDRLAVMRTVSKLGLAGVRLGYLAAAPHWIAEFDKVRPPYNVSVLDEAAAEFALEHLEVFDAQAARLRADREALAAALAGVPGVTAYPSRANFVLVRVADGPGTAAALRERGVLIKDVGRMHPLLAGCLRLTVGTPDENTQLLDALKASL
jgi:histidinol dehydrogenase